MRRAGGNHARTARGGGTHGRGPAARARGGMGGRRRRHTERRGPPARRLYTRAAARSLPLPRRRLRGRHLTRVPAPLRPALRLARRHHRPDDRQPRVGEPLQRLLPVLAREEGTQAAALDEHQPRRLADSLAQLDDGPRERLASAALAAKAGQGNAGRLPHRLLARAPLQRRRVRGRPGDGAALERAPRPRKAFLSGHDHNLQRMRPSGASPSTSRERAARRAMGWIRAIRSSPGAPPASSARCGSSSSRAGRLFEFRDYRGRLLDRSRRTCES